MNIEPIPKVDATPTPAIENQGNPMGIAGSIVSFLGLIICLSAAAYIFWLESQMIPDRKYDSDDLRVVTDSLSNGATFFGQFILFVVSGLVGGTFALAGLSLSVAGLFRIPNRLAYLGVGMGVCAFLALAVTFWYQAH